MGRFISVERIFEESKESYCDTLEASSQRWHEAAHDIAPWLDYFWGALLRAYVAVLQVPGSPDLRQHLSATVTGARDVSVPYSCKRD